MNEIPGNWFLAFGLDYLDSIVHILNWNIFLIYLFIINIFILIKIYFIL